MPEPAAGVACRKCRQPVHRSETGSRCTNPECERYFAEYGTLDQSERTVVRQGGIADGE